MSESLRCPVCDAEAEYFGTARVLGSHDAQYRRCVGCGAVFAANPTWLPEAYESPIAESDLGLVGRNIRTARVTRRVIRTLFRKAESFLDFGAGNGLFVRLMRDAGFPFRYVDAYGPNLFAKGFEAALGPGEQFDFSTAFEVLEHLTRPVDELRPLAASSNAVLATTLVLPSPAPPLNEWWYYALPSGQHVTLYTNRSLEVLAERLGFKCSSAGDVHLFSHRAVPDAALRLLVNERFRAAIGRRLRRRSLLADDYENLTGRPLR
ncbi:MAG: class I SAM-dependent methyltransferase [Gaiellaceae bacterium]